MEDNRRQADRISVSLGIVLDFSTGTREARISDISMLGCFVDLLADVRKGEMLFFTFSPPPVKSVRFYGEVVYIYPGIGFGLRFIQLTKEGQMILKQIILNHGGQGQQLSFYPVAKEETKSTTKVLKQEKSLLTAEKVQFNNIIKSIQESIENAKE